MLRLALPIIAKLRITASCVMSFWEKLISSMSSLWR
jgi:hypothetical protein